MKKILIALTITLSCLGIKSVSADVNNLELIDKTQESFAQYKQLIGNDNFNTIVNDVLNEYKNNYMSSYPYYYISVSFNYTDNFNTNSSFYIILNYFNEIPKGDFGVYLIGNDITKFYYWLPYSFRTNLAPYNYNYISREYSIYENSNFVFNSLNYNSGYYDSFHRYMISIEPDSSNYSYHPYLYYLSNFELTFKSIDSLSDEYTGFIFDYKNILIPKLGDENLNRVISLTQEDVFFEPYYLYDTDVNVSIPNIEEINLNDYAYIALALKDYQQDPFETTVQVKGQYCLTPVYNYGMTERKDILTGTQVERCSPYYENYTPIRTYILDNDLKNNAIYYLKSYDTTRDNYVKVDTSVFDVTYVTEENKDNPYVTIGGKTYPTIPYDSLTDTATKSEDEGYVSGAVEEFSFSDIFTAPLELLEDVWDSIVSVFDLVKELFSLLPEPIPTFLIISFTLAIVLGLLKIIL